MAQDKSPILNQTECKPLHKPSLTAWQTEARGTMTSWDKYCFKFIPLGQDTCVEALLSEYPMRISSEQPSYDILEIYLPVPDTSGIANPSSLTSAHRLLFINALKP